MDRNERLSGRSLAKPKALLLDFGGVIVETRRNPGWEVRLVKLVADNLAKAGVPALSPERITRDVVAGCKADSHWKNAMSRPFAPRELRQAEFWGDFVAADWPEAARAVVVADAAELCRQMGHFRSHRELRNGLLALLDACDAAAIAVAIVSNALAGDTHLDFLAAHGLTDRFAAIVHSSDVGVRKPNPEMILIATRALGIAAADAWYVGDNFDRDVLCGVRAGVGGNILMVARATWELPYDLDVLPDAIVADPAELLERLASAAPGAGSVSTTHNPN